MNGGAVTYTGIRPLCATKGSGVRQRETVAATLAPLTIPASVSFTTCTHTSAH